MTLVRTIHEPICGDGMIVGPEACDDSNDLRGDGCAADCLSIEEGWECFDGKCIPICGNGEINTDEECDDANNTDYDGCSSACLVEPGYDYSSGVCIIDSTITEPEMDMKDIDFAEKKVEFECNVNMDTSV